MTDCVFCRIVAGSIPATRVHEDEHTLAFMDIGQVNPGHVLVAVKRHVENLYALDEVQAAAVARASVRVARAIRDAFAPAGLSVYQANGKPAGQTVFHYHVHLLPRHDGDGMELTWPTKNPPREALEDHAAKIRARLARDSGPEDGVPAERAGTGAAR
jgi:histidine triad (HIT) family protein